MEVSMSAFDIFAKTPFDHLAAELLQKLDREITGQEANYMVPTEIFRFRWKALQAALCQNAGPHAIINTFTRTQEFEADMYGLNAARQPDGEAGRPVAERIPQAGPRPNRRVDLLRPPRRPHPHLRRHALEGREPGGRKSGAAAGDQRTSALNNSLYVAWVWARCCAGKPISTTLPCPNLAETTAALRARFSSPTSQPLSSSSRS